MKRNPNLVKMIKIFTDIIHIYPEMVHFTSKQDKFVKSLSPDEGIH